MPPGALVDCGVELEMHLIEAGCEQHGQAWAIVTPLHAIEETVGQPETDQVRGTVI